MTDAMSMRKGTCKMSRKEIIAVDRLDATAQALGIDTTSYQRSVLACTPTAIRGKAKELLREIDISRITKFTQELAAK